MKDYRITHTELTAIANFVGKCPWAQADPIMKIIQQVAKRALEVETTEEPKFEESGNPVPLRKA